MREEESILRVVGIFRGVAVSVVSTVVTRPVPDGPLVRPAVAEHQKNPHGESGRVGTVRPQAVRSSGDPQAIKGVEEDAKQEGLVRSNRDSGEDPHNSPKVHKSKVGDVEPVELGSEGFELSDRGGERMSCGGKPPIRGDEGSGTGFSSKTKGKDAEGEVKGFQRKNLVVVKRGNGESEGKDELQEKVSLFPVQKFAHHVVGRNEGADGFPQGGEDKLGRKCWGTRVSRGFQQGIQQGRRSGKDLKGAVDFVEGDRLQEILSRGRKRGEKSNDGIGVFL
jgi:hypothetical protein